MTSLERMFALYSATNYVLDNNIPGDFVECGVWRGGSSMMIALVLKQKNITDRKIYLYDTYEGMSEPTENDKDMKGQSAKVQLEATEEKENSVWCLADLDDVKNNMKRTSINENQLVYVKGKVEETIPATIPSGNISLLRLDTDWYESTKHELLHLYPKLSQNGVMIIDDYGHWQGCRKAIDDYFTQNNIKNILNRVDYTGRSMIKVF
jgi:hypothetical protein